ncbi:MAG TPA: glycosyltransferase family 39 protein [Isosphaeraceae bacterium]|jgi:4-amino-4-deoxy-L-arabinose transferase-like glycosyltransferase|nr:glycosyltransferase family 39 protein [Isosphaeraceae bacterium]
MARRPWFWVILLASSLHGLGIARSLVPAQDGLKFIRVARQFQTQPWTDVVRNTDRHPLYPAFVALAQPAVALLAGNGPASWRVAAQAVSALASIALLVPLYYLTRSLFNGRAAFLAALLFVLLPLPAEVGHDTLSDSLALLCNMVALCLGAEALRSPRLAPALGCGLAAGLGYLTRPEVVLVALAVMGAGLFGRLRREVCLPPAWRLATIAVACFSVVGTYALIKGEVSEKLALRWGAALPSRHDAPRKVKPWLPPGLDDPHWDFSAKEESEAPARASAIVAAGRVLSIWAEDLGWILAPLAVLGAWRLRASESHRSTQRMLALYIILFTLILVRHTMTLGYLSGRHALTLVLVSLPWSAAMIVAIGDRLAARRSWDDARRLRWRIVCLGALVVAGLVVQARSAHPSRWGHWAAGRWLAQHMDPSEAVLDTRGWASFVSDRTSYDYWHVRQAFTDAKLAYIVVGTDELSANSRRGATLQAVLAYAATPVISFPEREGGADPGVAIYRFHRPESWEGLRP